MKKQYRYYLIAASNGAMVHYDYSRVVYLRDKYFRAPCMIRKFDTAKEALIEAQEHLLRLFDDYYEIPTKLEVNKMYTRKSLSKTGESGVDLGTIPPIIFENMP